VVYKYTYKSVYLTSPNLWLSYWYRVSPLAESNTYAGKSHKRT